MWHQRLAGRAIRETAEYQIRVIASQIIIPENASEAFIRDRKKHWPEFVKIPDDANGWRSNHAPGAKPGWDAIGGGKPRQCC